MCFNNLLLHVPDLSRCLAYVIGASDGGCIKGGSARVRTSPDVPVVSLSRQTSGATWRARRTVTRRVDECVTILAAEL